MIAVDVDQERLNAVAHNAVIYGVQHQIVCLKGDFRIVAEQLHGSTSTRTNAVEWVFLSPPWGELYCPLSTEPFDVKALGDGLNGIDLLVTALCLAPAVAYYLPKQTDRGQLQALADSLGATLELEPWERPHSLLAYFTRRLLR